MKAVFLVIIASFIALSCAPPSFEASGYVFSYGVAAYPFPIKSLTYTDDDARAVYTMFNDAGYEAHLRIDDGGEYYSGYTALPATLEQLEADIAYVAGQIEKRDTVVFYFSGHGNSISPADDYINDEPNDDWFLLYYPSYMVDTDPKAAYLSDDTLGRLLSDIPRGKVVVLIDACYSGGFIASSPYPGMWSDPYYRFNEEPFTPPSLGELIAAWNGGLGKYDVSADTALMITAAGEYERSFEPPSYGHGVFTYFLLETPAQGDIDGDGYVSLFEMYEYVSYKVIQNWNNQGGTAFLPRATGSAVDFVLF